MWFHLYLASNKGGCIRAGQPIVHWYSKLVYLLVYQPEPEAEEPEEPEEPEQELADPAEEAVEEAEDGRAAYEALGEGEGEGGDEDDDIDEERRTRRQEGERFNSISEEIKALNEGKNSYLEMNKA